MTPTEKTFSELLKKYVTLANPSIPHALDEGRLLDALEYASENDLDLSTCVSKHWPMNTTRSLGGDPAHSEKLFEHTVRLVEEFKRSGTINGAAR
ncbi:hypothetical protein ABIE58_001370 [Roseovarius sp. MBR-78]|uniref:hypothetical protein n=1 Tax=Roseovarius sp. MBR-78 TaxID=3156460 RepID=UPI0033932A88